MKVTCSLLNLARPPSKEIKNKMEKNNKECRSCDGSGISEIDINGNVSCPTCEGTGNIKMKNTFESNGIIYRY